MAKVQKLLLDKGSSYNILFLEAFFNIWIDIKNLNPYTKGWSTS